MAAGHHGRDSAQRSLLGEKRLEPGEVVVAAHRKPKVATAGAKPVNVVWHRENEPSEAACRRVLVGRLGHRSPEGDSRSAAVAA